MFKKTFNGIVIGRTSKKTISVIVKKNIEHKMYKKKFITTKKYLVHDEYDCFNEGDRIKISSSKPLSKKKCWKIVSI